MGVGQGFGVGQSFGARTGVDASLSYESSLLNQVFQMFFSISGRHSQFCRNVSFEI